MRPQPKSAGEIARQFPGISRPAVSQHLRVLREARLITQEADGRRRLYGLHPPTLRQVDRWLARYRAFWTGRLESLKRLAERGTA